VLTPAHDLSDAGVVRQVPLVTVVTTPFESLKMLLELVI
jgi:hypothetical protein